MLQTKWMTLHGSGIVTSWMTIIRLILFWYMVGWLWGMIGRLRCMVGWLWGMIDRLRCMVGWLWGMVGWCRLMVLCCNTKYFFE